MNRIPGFFATNIIRPFLKRFFRLLYHQFAWSYDLVSGIVSIGAWKKWVLSITDYIKGPRILELGYGPGHLQFSLASSCHQTKIFGLDASPQMSKIAARRFARAGQKHKLVLGNAGNLPFVNSWFDQIVATFPSEYIFQQATVQEVKRVLKSDGNLVALFQAQITGRQPLLRAASWLFNVTGETLEWDAATRETAFKPFIDAGFEANIEIMEVDGSRLSYILVKLPEPDSPN